VNTFDIAAILIAIAAVFGYINHRVPRLPQTSSTLLIALISSLVADSPYKGAPATFMQDLPRWHATRLLRPIGCLAACATSCQ